MPLPVVQSVRPSAGNIRESTTVLCLGRCSLCTVPRKFTSKNSDLLYLVPWALLLLPSKRCSSPVSFQGVPPRFAVLCISAVDAIECSAVLCRSFFSRFQWPKALQRARRVPHQCPSA